ncbi:MAG: tyrosine-type recombinase/integrase, partial [Anaerolineae bacterium]
TALAALWRQRAQLAREREYAPEWPDSDLVFISAHGQPLDASYVTHTLQRLLDDAGQPRLRFHDLRHGFATLMLAQGANPRTVQETLGHSQISLTLGTYSHVPREVQREAVERLDDVLGGAV